MGRCITVKGGSHLLVSYAALYATHRLIVPLAASPVDWLVILGAASVGALLPDVDSDESAIRQATHTARSNGCLGRLSSLGISAITGGHRNFTHTLAAWGMFTVLFLMGAMQFRVIGAAVAFSIPRPRRRGPARAAPPPTPGRRRAARSAARPRRRRSPEPSSRSGATPTPRGAPR